MNNTPIRNRLIVLAVLVFISAIAIALPLQLSPVASRDQCVLELERSAVALRRRSLDVAELYKKANILGIELESQLVTKSLVDAMNECPNLVEVSLRKCVVDRAHDVLLSQSGDLHQLILREMVVDDMLAGDISHLTRLDTLSMVDCQIHTNLGAIISELPALNVLNCRRSMIQWDSLDDHAFSEVPHIVFSGTTLNDTRLKQLLLSDQLRSLAVDGCPITDESVAILCRLPRLERLNLSDTPITETSVSYISHSASLSEVIALRCRIPELTSGNLPNRCKLVLQ